MGLQGRLTRERMTYTMPPVSPLYPMPPIHAPGVETLTVTYETDTAAALEYLPSVLEIVEPATVTVGIFHIVEGSLGSYYEANMFIPALHEGKLVRYSPLMLVTNDMAMNYGREVLGLPKKKAHIAMEHRPEGVIGYAERPAGYRLLSLGVALETEIDLTTVQPVPGVPAVGLRIIGEPEGSDPKVRMELVEAMSAWQMKEQWTGKGSISFTPARQIDNWNIMPVKRIVSAGYGVCDIQIPWPRLLAVL